MKLKSLILAVSLVAAGQAVARSLSHYNLDKLQKNHRSFTLYPDLFDKKNAWLSGHTHRWKDSAYLTPRVYDFPDQGLKTFSEVNTGFITDHEMHINIVTIGLTKEGATPLEHLGLRWALSNDQKLNGQDGLCLEVAKK